MSPRCGRRRCWAGLVEILSLQAPRAVLAQTPAGGALDRYDPAPAGDPFFSTPSADVTSRLRFGAAAHVAYAHDPLVLRRLPSGPVLQWVKDQALLHRQASAAVLRRLKLDLDVPILLAEGVVSGTL